VVGSSATKNCPGSSPSAVALRGAAN
jgi:hypothetical protein